MLRQAILTIIAGAFLAACNQQAADDAAPTDTAGGVQGMEGMRGMQGMGGSGDMMQQMEAHMKMMDGVQGDSLRNMANMHRIMAANMLAQMNRDMQQMNMAADAKWTALADSVRQDLTRMPEWNTQEMHVAMPAHVSRMRRLMEIHTAMMKTM